ncbi:MAG: hypothetical protein GW938_00005 [Leptospira sp.]|nr:hypothetical protein [Leptospira sp.]NCS94561.1 hypothetical protein [Leptospira sp.]
MNLKTIIAIAALNVILLSSCALSQNKDQNTNCSEQNNGTLDTSKTPCEEESSSTSSSSVDDAEVDFSKQR